jgi:hypothetical protein
VSLPEFLLLTSLCALMLCRCSCECFNILDPAKQKQIADELERTPGEVAKKLEDMRNRLM